MLRLPRSEIVVGAALASLFWIAVLGWQSSYTPTERQKDECYDAAKKTGYKNEECKTLWERTTSDPIALFNLILAFSTVGLWVATISLYRAGDKQFTLARQEFIATHRPKVIVRFIQEPFYDDSMIRKAWVTVVNIGVNPAIIEEFGGDIAYRNRYGWLPPGLDASPRHITPVTLSSGQRHVFTVSAKLPFSENDIAESVSGERITCIVGSIKYGDGQGVVRDTGFFRVYDELGETFTNSKNPEEEYQD
jgi:hypothetical protein